MGRMSSVIHSPKFGTGYPHSPKFGTKSEYDMGLTVTKNHSPKFGTCHPHSRDRGKCPQAHLILLGVAKNKVILRSFMLILVLVADLLTDVKNEP